MCALLLGVRADSTHTEAVLADSGGKPWGRVKIPNGEARSSRELLERAFQEASIEFPGTIPPLVAVMALPGLRSASIRRAAAETIKAVLPAGSRAVLCDDLEPVLAGGLAGQSGLLVVSGQQAAVGVVDLHGFFSRLEEPPEELGQEGSGLWLGTRTLQLVARLREGRLPESARLVSAMCEHFQQPTLQQVWDHVMSSPPDAQSMMALGQRTIELAAFPEPEPACRALVVRAARRLCDLVIQAQNEPLDSPAATWCGSALGGALLEEVTRQTPELRWQPAYAKGLEGCLFMAQARGEAGLGAGECEVEDAEAALWLAMRARHEMLQAVSQELRAPH